MACEPLAAVDAAKIGNHRTREVDSAPRRVDHDLGRVGVLQRLQPVLDGKGLNQCGDIGLRVVEAAHDGLDLRGHDERLVALHVDYAVEAAAHIAESLVTAVGAAAVLGRGHDRTAAEALHGIGYAAIVGGHDHIVDGLRHLTVYAFDDRASAQQRQRLGRKARRRITRRDYGYELHISSAMRVSALRRWCARSGTSAPRRIRV